MVCVLMGLCEDGCEEGWMVGLWIDGRRVLHARYVVASVIDATITATPS